MPTVPATSQVVPPEQIEDAESRSLQQKYWRQLNSLGEDLAAERFPYRFYFSRKLDIDEGKQKRTDQRSIRFGKFQGRTVLEISGNYYAAYSRDLMGPEERASQSLHDLLLPILRIAVHAFEDNPDIEGYAIETSHHVFGKVWGISVENSENIFLMVPQRVAQRVLQADEAVDQGMLAQSQLLLNGKTLPKASKRTDSGP